MVSFSELACVNSRGEDDFLLVIRIDPGDPQEPEDGAASA
jgi:hypothetical protein